MANLRPARKSVGDDNRVGRRLRRLPESELARRSLSTPRNDRGRSRMHPPSRNIPRRAPRAARSPRATGSRSRRRFPRLPSDDNGPARLSFGRSSGGAKSGASRARNSSSRNEVRRERLRRAGRPGKATAARRETSGYNSAPARRPEFRRRRTDRARPSLRGAAPSRDRASPGRRADGRSIARPRGTITRNPARSRTSTAAIATCGSKKVVEGVGEQHDFAHARSGSRPALEP